MRIADYRTFTVANPPPSFGGRYFSFLKLVSDDGIVGWGEAYSLPFHPRVVEAMAADVVERLVIGRDPFRIEDLWRRVYSSGYSQRPDPSLMAVLSAIEMALWDIVGKALDRPVHALLGGKVRERLRAYTYIYPAPGEDESVYRDPDLAATRAVDYLAMGFTALKFDPAGPYTAFDPRQRSLEELDRSERFVRRLREAVGDRADLLFGTHGQMTPAGAVRLARRLEPYDPLWFEEPVPPEMPERMAEVAAKTTIPIAAGERLTTKYEFERLLSAKAAAILQPDLGRVGGILEAKKIAAIAEAHYAEMAPHCYCGPVVGAANIQLSASIPNFLILESILDWSGFHSEILVEPIPFEAGYVTVTDRPGLGVEVNEAVALANPYAGDKLHLDMHDTTALPEWRTT